MLNNIHSQDASLIRLPRAYAPYVQAGLQAYVLLSRWWINLVKLILNFRTWSHQAVYFPCQLSRRRHRWYQGKRCTTKGHAPQILSWVCFYHCEIAPIVDLWSERRTGIVYNVTPSAVGVIVYKVVGNRYLEKRVNLRVEHVRHSKCRQEFLDRVKANHEAHVAAKESGSKWFVEILCWFRLLTTND